MKKDCEKLIEDYLKWIKDNTLIEEIGGASGKQCKVITPALDRHNDHIEFFIDHKNDKIILTDDGYIINDLAMSGMEFNTPKRKKLLLEVLNGFGVKLGNNDALYSEASHSNFGQRKHSLLQAMLAVNDLNALSQESVFSFFKEDVETFFNQKGIVYSMDIKITGKSGIDQNIDFLISKSNTKPERLIKTINMPQRNNVIGAVFSLSDVAMVRKEKPVSYVIYNDTEEKVSEDLIEAFTNYEINPIPWSQKEKYIKELALV